MKTILLLVAAIAVLLVGSSIFGWFLRGPEGSTDDDDGGLPEDKDERK